VAFFYFDYQEQSEQSPSTVLCSILRQLLENLDQIPELVASVYQCLHSRGKLPLYESKRLLTATVKELGRAFIVIDGLDECDIKHRPSLLEMLQHLSQVQNLGLLVTSRPHVEDITEVFHRWPRLEVAAHEEDIRTYLTQELDRRQLDSSVDAAFISRLVHKLTGEADGMYVSHFRHSRLLS